ncbi:MAG: hypothetical protein HZA24_00450 [Nitrospirae bacterium]|nr:hypothetical protein [Nitrospirota bacterium]
MKFTHSAFREDDDAAFIHIVSGHIASDAPKKRGVVPSDYVNLARQVWSTCEVDAVYAIKILCDPLVQPEYQSESEEDMFCVLVARVDHSGNLIDAPVDYQPPNIPGVRLSHIVAGSPHSGQRQDPTRPANYVLAYFDVLGFESLLNKVGLDAVYQLYVQLLETALAPHSEERPWSKALSIVQGDIAPALMWLPIETAYSSDSLLLWIPYHPQYIEEFFRRCSLVFCQALQMGLPLRGAITVGRAVLNKERNIFIGHPLVEGARLESKLNWIGVALGASVKSDEIRMPIPPVSVLFYAPTFKKGSDDLFSGLVLDWPRVWRETRTESAIDYLQTLCTPDLPDSLKQRYIDTETFYKHSDENQGWDLPDGATRIKV